MWDANSKTSVNALKTETGREENINLAMSPDGNYLAVSNVKDELSIFDIRNLQLQKPVKFLK